jgi:Tol biopolymer transport system component
VGGRLRWGIALIVAVSACLYAAPALATFPGGNGRIAFSSNADGDYELYTMDADGTGRVQVTHNDQDANLSPLTDQNPKWSPRGDRLLFIRRRIIPPLALDSLYTANPDGTAEQFLFESILIDNGWSPDGNRIVYTVCTSFGFNSCFGYSARTRSRDGSAGASLARNGSRSEVEVDWSPQGDRIAVTDGGDIWTVPPDGSGGVTPLVTGQGDNSGPSWSPDGQRLAFVSNRDGNYEIYVMNADGMGQTRLTTNAVHDGNPAWSPDGTMIAFDRAECNESRCVSNILTMDVDGTNEVQLTSNQLPSGASERSPDWQPIPGPQRGDFKNQAQFCKAERAFWGEAGFRARYGGGANAHGKCVSSG